MVVFFVQKSRQMSMISVFSVQCFFSALKTVILVPLPVYEGPSTLIVVTVAMKHLWKRRSGSGGWLSQSNLPLRKCFRSPCGPVGATHWLGPCCWLGSLPETQSPFWHLTLVNDWMKPMKCGEKKINVSVYCHTSYCNCTGDRGYAENTSVFGKKSLISSGSVHSMLTWRCFTQDASSFQFYILVNSAPKRLRRAAFRRKSDSQLICRLRLTVGGSHVSFASCHKVNNNCSLQLQSEWDCVPRY